MEKPKQLPDIDIEIDSIKEMCQNYIDFVASDDYHEDNDFKHYIFETTLESIFGRQVWEYINSKR